MRTLQSHRQPAGSPSSRTSGAPTPLSAASVTIAALLILTVPVCSSASAELQQSTADRTQRLRQLDAVCSSYLFADLKLGASDALGELCVLMLLQQSKELKLQGKSKRADIQGPGGIQSRGYFLYRPRNGRRALENE